MEFSERALGGVVFNEVGWRVRREIGRYNPESFYVSFW